MAFFDAMPVDEEMLRIANEVGYSETAFLVRQADDWRVRYFTTVIEVSFCGHVIPFVGEIWPKCWGERGGQWRDKIHLH